MKIHLHSVLWLAAAFTLPGNLHASKGHGGTLLEATAPAKDAFTSDGMYFTCQGNEVVIQNCKGKVTKVGQGCEGSEKRRVKKEDFLLQIRTGAALKIEPALLGMTESEMAKIKSGNQNQLLYRRLGIMKASVDRALGFLAVLILTGGSEGRVRELREIKQEILHLQKILDEKKPEAARVKSAVKTINTRLAGVINEDICDPAVPHEAKPGTLLGDLLKHYDPTPVAPNETLANGKLKVVKREVGSDGTNRDYLKDMVSGITWGPIEDLDEQKRIQERDSLTFKTKEGQFPDFAAAAKLQCSEKDPKGKWELPKEDDIPGYLPDMDDGAFWLSPDDPPLDSGQPVGLVPVYIAAMGYVRLARPDFWPMSVRCIRR